MLLCRGFGHCQRALLAPPRREPCQLIARKQTVAAASVSDKALWESLDPDRKALGVDFGTVKTGLAVSTGGLAPRPLKVVYLRHQELIEEVRATARAEGVSEIVVGIPSGRTSQSRKCFEFAERLADATYREGWRIWLADESYSSAEASAVLLAAGVPKAAQRSGGGGASSSRVLVDAVAAALILESYFSGRAGPPQLMQPAKHLLEDLQRNPQGGAGDGDADGERGASPGDIASPSSSIGRATPREFLLRKRGGAAADGDAGGDGDAPAAAAKPPPPPLPPAVRRKTPLGTRKDVIAGQQPGSRAAAMAAMFDDMMGLPGGGAGSSSPLAPSNYGGGGGGGRRKEDQQQQQQDAAGDDADSRRLGDGAESVRRQRIEKEGDGVGHPSTK